jgi:acyl-CoA thioesterase-1
MTSLSKLTYLAALWTGCALWAVAGVTAIAATGKKGRIVVLGDSLTAGYGIDPKLSYPALLQQEIDRAGLSFEVVNAGVSGDTTSGGLRRVDWVLGKGADVLILALGGNDGLRGVPPQQMEANLRGIVERARKKAPGVVVVIAGMEMPASMGREYAQQFASVFPRVAAEMKAELVPYLLEGVGGVSSLNQPDLIHPTAEGQKLIARNVWSILRKVLVRVTPE